MLRDLKKQFGVFFDAGLNHGADAMVDQGMKVLFDTDPALYRALARNVADHPKTVETAIATAVQGFDWGMKAIYRFLPATIRVLTAETDFGEDFLAKIPTAVVRHFQVNPIAEPAEQDSSDMLHKNVTAVTTSLHNIRHTLLDRPREFANRIWGATKKKAGEEGVSERTLLFRAELAEDRDRQLDTMFREGDEITRAVIASHRAGEPWGTELKRRIKESGNR